jgi:dipeptidyl aminopeptidase/acylaminoacyl peptidase
MRTVCRVFLFTVLTAGLATGQEEWLTPPSNLTLDGIPKIPASLARLGLRFRTGFADHLCGWDPLKYEALLTRGSYSDSLLFKVDGPGGRQRVLGFLPNGTRELYYNRGGKYSVVQVSGPSELYQLYRRDLSVDNKSVLLTDGKSKNRWPCWSNSGEWLMYSSNRRNGKDMDIYMVNPLDPTTDRLVAQLDGESWGAYDWSPDDRKVILTEYKSANESYLWVLDLETKSKKRITPSKHGALIYNGYLAQFSADGKGVYHVTDRNSEFLSLAYLDLATTRYTYLTNGESDIEELVMSPDRTLLAFTVNEQGLSRLHILDTATKTEKPVPDPPSGVISKMMWHNDSNLLGFTLSSAVRPGDLYSIDIKQNTFGQWTSSSSGANPDELREPELITWRSFDGKRISGFLYRPHQRPGRLPVIIDIHGGPQLQSRPSFNPQDCVLMAELGVALIYPNIRGSTGYGKTFVRLDDGVLRPNCTKDIAALLDWIKNQQDLDFTRVVVRGSSYGGYVALSVAVTYGDRIRGAIASSAPSNLATLVRSADKSLQDQTRLEYGDERDSKVRRLLESIAPSNRTPKKVAPLLIAHGGQDSRVPVSEANQMVEAARKQGIPLWYLLAKDDGHWMSLKSRDFLFYAQVMLIQRQLLIS